MKNKWLKPWTTQSKCWEDEKRFKNETELSKLHMLYAFWNSPTFDKLGEPSKDAFMRVVWEAEYVLGINNKPCLRCGTKPEWGEYYCNDCLNKEDHPTYMLINQRMHEDKNTYLKEKDRMKLETILEKFYIIRKK